MTQTATLAPVAEAIERMKLELVRLIETYDMVSARGLLLKIGYSDFPGSEPSVTQVLERIAEGGFRYCLDPSIRQNLEQDEKQHDEFPPLFACMWGPDQLLSRLNCLHW